MVENRLILDFLLSEFDSKTDLFSQGVLVKIEKDLYFLYTSILFVLLQIINPKCRWI